MHAILYNIVKFFKAPLFHYKTSLVGDSSIYSSETLSDRNSSKLTFLILARDCIRNLKELYVQALLIQNHKDLFLTNTNDGNLLQTLQKKPPYVSLIFQPLPPLSSGRWTPKTK